jgi:glutamate racemase
MAGPTVRIVDSGNAVARRAREVLVQAGLLAGIAAIPELRIHTSGEPDLVGPIVERMIGNRLPVGLIADDRVLMTA